MIERGSNVAILPAASSPPADVLEIAAVVFAGSVYVQLIDGRMFATIGGQSLCRLPATYIVPATDEHSAALRAKTPAAIN